MSFSTEEILEELASETSEKLFSVIQIRDRERDRELGLGIHFAEARTGPRTRKTREELYREMKKDNARLARRRQVARESAARIYAKKPLAERTAPMKRYLEALRADPVRYAAYLENRRAARRKQ